MPQNAPKDEKWLLRELEALRRRVKALETAPRTGNASVSYGKFVILDGETGNEVLRIGYLGQTGGEDVRGTQLTRPTGERVLSTWSGEAAAYWGLYDLSHNVIVSDDYVSRQGLARPYVGGPNFAPADTSTWTAVTSGSFQTMFWGQWVKQHPQLHVFVATVSDSGTTGEVQVTCNGASATQTIPSNDDTIRSLIFPVPGDLYSSFTITVAIRRTGGTGVVACYPYGAYGRQS